MSYLERLESIDEYLSLADATRGELPPIDIVETYLASRVSGIEPGLERLGALADHAVQMREEMLNAFGHIGNSKCPHQDIFTALFLDSVVYAATDLTLEIHRNGRYGTLGRDPEILRKLLGNQIYAKVAARKDLQSRLLAFADIYEGSNEHLIRQSLLSITYEAYSLANDESDGAMDTPAKALAGLIAEVKVFRGLKQLGWHRSELSEIEADMRLETDALIRLEDDKEIPVQVKANRAFEVTIENFGGRVGLIIKVPTRYSLHYLDLDETELKEIKRKVEDLCLANWAIGQLALSLEPSICR